MTGSGPPPAGDWLRLATLFLDVCDLGAAEREARLAAESAAVAGEVRALIEAADREPAARPRRRPGIEDWLGRDVAGYDLVEHLGTGGMGAVFRGVRPAWPGCSTRVSMRERPKGSRT